jgi:tripartite-type tricarboxylate transporter receptor subunit TctC
MKPARREVLELAAGAAALLMLSRLALAQSYPTRPVRLIEGFPAGTSTDMVVRMMAQWLSDRLAQPFIVEYRPGAASNIATEAVSKADPDGYTLLCATAVNVVNASFYRNLGFDFIRDLVPIASLARVPLVLEVSPSIPVRTVPELITYASAHPGRLNFGSAGNGTVTHIVGELLKMMAGVDMLHVPYRGTAPALLDLLTGHIQVMFDLLPASIEHVRTGKVRALAVTTTTRSPVLRDIPTMSEFLPGFEASAWFGMVGPRRTSADVVAKLNSEINAGLADPAITARLAELGVTPFSSSPAEFGRFIAAEAEKWAKVVEFSGAKPH